MGPLDRRVGVRRVIELDIRKGLNATDERCRPLDVGRAEGGIEFAVLRRRPQREGCGIAGELDEGNVVFIVCDDGWKYLSSGIYTRPVEEIERLDSTVWW